MCAMLEQRIRNEPCDTSIVEWKKTEDRSTLNKIRRT